MITFSLEYTKDAKSLIEKAKSEGHVLTEVSTNDSPYKTYAYVNVVSNSATIKYYQKQIQHFYQKIRQNYLQVLE